MNYNTVLFVTKSFTVDKVLSLGFGNQALSLLLFCSDEGWQFIDKGVESDVE